MTTGVPRSAGMAAARRLALVAVLLPGCTASYMGGWAVTDAKFPGVSAMAMSEAREWFGSEAVYSASAVTFREERCDDPRFSVASLTEEDFREDYRATFADLDIDSTQVEVLQVSCPSNWISPVSTLIQIDGNTAFMLWDGVFFKMERVAP